MKQDEIRAIDVSGEPDCRWEGFLRYATDRLKTPVTVMGLALQRMEEVLETARKEQRRV